MIDYAMIPKRILIKIDGLKWIDDNIGKSDSTIVLFDEMVLKSKGYPVLLNMK